MSLAQKSSAELLKILKEAIAGKPEKVPSGFKTAAEWSAEWSVGKTRAKELITAGVRGGLMVRKDVRIPSAGTVRPVPHYGPA